MVPAPGHTHSRLEAVLKITINGAVGVSKVRGHPAYFARRRSRTRPASEEIANYVNDLMSRDAPGDTRLVARADGVSRGRD